MKTAARPGTRAHDMQRRVLLAQRSARHRSDRGPSLVALVVTLVLLSLPVTLTIAFGAAGRL